MVGLLLVGFLIGGFGVVIIVGRIGVIALGTNRSIFLLFIKQIQHVRSVILQFVQNQIESHFLVVVCLFQLLPD